MLQEILATNPLDQITEQDVRDAIQLVRELARPQYRNLWFADSDDLTEENQFSQVEP